MEKRLHECEGCSDDNGKKKSIQCVIAQCSGEKQHASCQKCYERKGCIIYHSVMTKEAPMLGRWISVLFWLIVPSLVASVLTSESIVKMLPKVELPGQILSVACAVVYGLILLKLSSAHSKYKIAGICYLSLQIMSVAGYTLKDGSGWYIFLSIVMVIVSLICEYNEIEAHSDVLEDIDDELASKWYGLWIANIVMVAGIIGGTILLFVWEGLGALILIASSICAIVIGVLKLIYLYRTAGVFKKISGKI